MAGFIELQRNLLEEIETIEVAISDRIVRNPGILPENPTDIKRPYKQTLLQQHEVADFQQKYKRHCNTLVKNLNSKGEFEAELELISDPQNRFEKFDGILDGLKVKHANDSMVNLNLGQDLKKIYSSFSSGFALAQTVVDKCGNKKMRVKRKYILSSAADHIDLNTLFLVEEMFGKQLDLIPFYQIYKTLNPNFTTYLQYLHDFHIPLSEKLPEYMEYLKELTDYLISFIKRSQPLLNYENLQQDWENQFESDKSALSSGVANEDGSVYCEACDKKFAKLSVYNGHLPGKKHKKNAQLLESTVETKKLTTPTTAKLEFMLEKLGQYLNSYKEYTISNTERKDAMTDREKLIEMASITGDDSDYTTVDEDDEDDEDNFDDDGEILNMKDLPLGVDGKPMPYWLFKLQGLHKTYNCEICGNISYKGRVSYDKHFGSTKHMYGLKCLGVTNEYVNLFTNIGRIEEAVVLWKKLKKSNRIKEGDEENAIEVEDTDGNVMSEKDYLDLKKQGLL
jgi:splicing factor 3A subunit 3